VYTSALIQVQTSGRYNLFFFYF